MLNTNDLNPLFEYLPLCAQTRETKDENGKTVSEVKYLKTYPPYPWLPGTGDHFDDDPQEFIDLCAAEGLVHWETEEQRKDRIGRQKAFEEQSAEQYFD